METAGADINAQRSGGGGATITSAAGAKTTGRGWYPLWAREAICEQQQRRPPQSSHIFHGIKASGCEEKAVAASSLRGEKLEAREGEGAEEGGSLIDGNGGDADVDGAVDDDDHSGAAEGHALQLTALLLSQGSYLASLLNDYTLTTNGEEGEKFRDTEASAAAAAALRRLVALCASLAVAAALPYAASVAVAWPAADHSALLRRLFETLLADLGATTTTAVEPRDDGVNTSSRSQLCTHASAAVGSADPTGISMALILSNPFAAREARALFQPKSSSSSSPASSAAFCLVAASPLPPLADSQQGSLLQGAADVCFAWSTVIQSVL